MNTRIEVPLTLPPPHFDDERTIATARQVKPIGRAKVSEGWRRMRTLLPLLFLATLSGGLGAAIVNYYEGGRTAAALPPTPSQVNGAAPAQTKAEPTPVAIAASTELNESKASIENKAAEVEPPANEQEEQPSKDAAPTPATVNHNAPKPANQNADTDATKLTRKRRVQPIEDPNTHGQKSGAARISDIFSGPNP